MIIFKCMGLKPHKLKKMLAESAESFGIGLSLF